MRSTLALAALLVLAGPSAALATPQLQVCHDDTIPLATTNWSSAVSVPKFDAGLGLLTSVEFELTGGIFGSAAIESFDASATTVTTSFQATMTLTRPDQSVLVVAVPMQQFVDDLSSYDGTFDFGGASGITHGDISSQDVRSLISTSPADLALFTGTGDIVLPVDAAGSSTASGSGNLITQFLTDARAGLRVCYNYAPDCNGNGVPDGDDITGQYSNDHDLDGVPDECQPGWRSLCEGDGAATGGGIECPCGNNGAPGEGCDNGSGAGGLLSASGVPSVSNDTLTLTASQIPQVPGFFLAGSLTAGGEAGVAFDNGLRCINPTSWLEKLDNGGSIPLPSAPPLSLITAAAPGDTMVFQYWHRNAGGPCRAGVNATNALEVTWGL